MQCLVVDTELNDLRRDDVSAHFPAVFTVLLHHLIALDALLWYVLGSPTATQRRSMGSGRWVTLLTPPTLRRGVDDGAES